jgi:DNA-binding response OmpR family regulator
MPAIGQELQGLRILVVEDNFLVAEDLRELLSRQGCDVVGPVPRVEQGLGLLAERELDGAVLDVNLGSEDCFPIAAALQERRVPFVFLSGYSDRLSIPDSFADVPMLSKPVDAARLVSAARAIFS